MTQEGRGNVPPKRRSPRYPVEKVQGVLHFTTDARVLNLSLTGIALESGLSVRVGRVYTIALRKDSEQSVRLSATVMWCHLREFRKTHLGESQPVYVAGLQFTNTLTQEAGQLVRFLEQTAVVSVGQRVTGRFRLAHEQPASVDAEYEFLVKNVSLHGLLIETELSPQVGAVFEIEVNLPGFTLQTQARVAHAKERRLVDKRTVTEVGMEYVDLAAENQARLGSFIAGELQAPQSAPS